jgi:hypothetical protein
LDKSPAGGDRVGALPNGKAHLCHHREGLENILSEQLTSQIL